METSNCCVRNCCGPQRPMEIRIFDLFQNEVIHLHRPYNCQSFCFPCCLQVGSISFCKIVVKGFSIFPRGQHISYIVLLYSAAMGGPVQMVLVHTRDVTRFHCVPMHFNRNDGELTPCTVKRFCAEYNSVYYCRISCYVCLRLCFLFCILQLMEVSSPPGTIVGTVKQCWSLWPKFELEDSFGNTVLRIEGPFFPCSCCCTDVNFDVS